MGDFEDPRRKEEQKSGWIPENFDKFLMNFQTFDAILMSFENLNVILMSFDVILTSFLNF